MSDQPGGVDDQKAIEEPAEAPPTKVERDQRRAVGDFSGAKSDGKFSMHVRVYSPFRDYYDGSAFSLSAENATGPFDILPKHHNFISLLTACELNVRTVSGGDQKIRISGGILHVKANQVIVFLDV